MEERRLRRADREREAVRDGLALPLRAGRVKKSGLNAAPLMESDHIYQL